jgi:hypothetical protein
MFQVNKEPVNMSCSGTFECNNNVGLSCINGQCECNSTQYYDFLDNYTCGKFKIFLFIKLCSYSGLVDVVQWVWSMFNSWCQLTSNYNIDHTTVFIFDLFYFFHYLIANKLAVNETCFGSYMCNDNLGLVCSGGFCDCNSTQYYNSTTRTCGMVILERELQLP